MRRSLVKDPAHEETGGHREAELVSGHTCAECQLQQPQSAVYDLLERSPQLPNARDMGLSVND